MRALIGSFHISCVTIQWSPSRTPVFAGEIVCDGICSPKPVDATCHFDAGGVCRGASR
jgi:hypothetical protein